ncbi:hypothetical protein Hanom_Chr01g00052801 [Helianthus anomalus]
MRDIYIFLTFFNNISRLTPRPASRLTPREAKRKRLDTRFSLFKPWVEVRLSTSYPPQTLP